MLVSGTYHVTSHCIDKSIILPSDNLLQEMISRPRTYQSSYKIPCHRTSSSAIKVLSRYALDPSLYHIYALSLELRTGFKNPLHKTSALLRPWCHYRYDVEQPNSRPGRHEPAQESFSFSDRLYNSRTYRFGATEIRHRCAVRKSRK